MPAHYSSDTYSSGIIEGFYGPTWSWQVRHHYLTFLKEFGYSFYIYAPKSDRILRKDWQGRWDDNTLTQLKHFRHECEKTGIKFGIGLSPYEVFLDYPGKRTALRDKIKDIHQQVSPDMLCILFDDMHGSYPNLAKTQIEIIQDVAEASPQIPIVMCPTYYTTQPLLQELFGKMPENYLGDLGRGLPSNVHVFWTGEKICSDSYSEEHMKWVVKELGRKPFLWDNYPVNDDRLMSPFLHLKPFAGRDGHLKEHLFAHAVNPMMQPYLSQIPLATLHLNLEGNSTPEIALKTALTRLCDAELTEFLMEDFNLFTETGRNNLSEEQKIHIARRYGARSACPFSREIIAWLAGEFQFHDSWLT